MRGCERGRDRGFVTAETAMALPVLVLFVTVLAWGLLVVLAQIQCVDAARSGARAAARQDPDGAVTAVAREAAPHGARITVTREGADVHVVVVAHPPGMGVLPVELREEAVAETEESVGTGAAPEARPGGTGRTAGAVP
ncbi:TadE family type IV pilus minor pilin [Streptomyces tropicalis]|uniref:TadE family type IV pilus minor pilin n=1 Tax=Streptomyces tropicalis TaxID=3034234 RepID=A0ABT6A7Q1_9ACTN|nr:TadE family type IV pilus minor pilin [Streptomyces tropicalis]MDF3300672.1 TadE family type IV pilus minor pilin [Streptomyces tropicalis]